MKYAWTGMNNQKWQGLKQNETKMAVKTSVKAEYRVRKMGRNKQYWIKRVKSQTNTKWKRNE